MTEYGPTPSVACTEFTYARYIHGGITVDYTPSADVSAGDVIVQGAMAAIARVPIPANTKGSLCVEGVFEFAKAASDGGMAVGTVAYWDASAHVATGTVGSNTYLGKVETTAATGDVVVRVQVEAMANASGTAAFTTLPSATVVATGTGSPNGAALALGFELVTAADGTKAATLPTAVAGKSVIVKNNSASALLVFPNSADKINGGTATTGSLSMAAYTTAMFVAYDATDWYSLPLVPS
jgi:predicted RecA/RadA family phage recombinase